MHTKINKRTVGIFIIGLLCISPILSSAQAAETTSGIILEQSNYLVNILPGKAITISVKIQNTGSTTWNAHSSDNLAIVSSKNPSPVKHVYWKNSDTALSSNKKVSPGEIVTLQFALQAPSNIGLVSEHFGLTHNGSLVSGTLFELPVNVTQYPTAKTPTPKPQPPVTENQAQQPTYTEPNKTETQPSAAAPTQTLNNDPSPYEPPTPQIAGVHTVTNIQLLQSEPIISVGLYYDTEKKITVTADGEFGLYENGTKQGSYGAGTMVTIQYIGGSYNVILPSGTASFNNVLTFKPLSNSTILEVASYERRTGWNYALNDNRFKGEIEVKYNPKTDRLWAINNLLLEDYVKGIAEVSNVDVPELHKVMAVISRTYALYHLLDNSRYDGFFHVTDDTDQVYRGYNSAMRMPLFTKEVDATAGQVVTLDNQLVVTPYFTQSDGQTKSYESVWGNSGIEIAHLQSVPVPQDAGRELLGHGVGLSAQAAQRMAYLEHMDYQSILKHFYLNTLVNQAY